MHETAMQLSALDHLQQTYAIAAGVSPAMCGSDGKRVYDQMVHQFLGIYNG